MIIRIFLYLWRSIWWTLKFTFMSIVLLLILGSIAWWHTARLPPPKSLPLVKSGDSNSHDSATFLSNPQIYELIKRATLKETAEEVIDQWVRDLRLALDRNEFAISRENVCAMIAIIAQESSFNENPAVDNLGALSKAAVLKKVSSLSSVPFLDLDQTALEWLYTQPSSSNSYLIQLEQVKTERDLDYLYRKMVVGLGEQGIGLLSKGAAKNTQALLEKSPILVRDLIELSNEIDTLGSMQVSVRFALKEAEKASNRSLMLGEVWKLRDSMYTREGGMYYGARQLLGYKTHYTQKIHRFADFNAGRYASRNASVQNMINQLLPESLVLDGDLLLYDKNNEAKAAVSNTEQALRQLVKRYNLPLSDHTLREDLALEKSYEFYHTSLYLQLTRLYQTQTGQVPAPALLPQIRLNSEKTSTTVLTTERFAHRVNQRYRACMTQSLALSLKVGVLAKF